MAEKTLQRVEDELTTCSICLDTYTNPKLLQCFHVYCQGCLERLVKDKHVIICPCCRQHTPKPVNGMASLQPAFYISHLLVIMQEHRIGQSGNVASHSKHNSSSIIVPLCSEHKDEETKLYCDTCEKLICFKCATGRGKHRSHNQEPLDEAISKYKEEIASSLEPVEKQMVCVEEALGKVRVACKSITDLQESGKASIECTFDLLHDILAFRKAQMITELQKITDDKLSKLSAQREQLETTHSQLRSCLDFMVNSIDSGKHYDGLLLKKSILRQVKDLTAPFQPDLLHPCTEADVAFWGPASMIEDCKSYGKLIYHDDVFPPECHATGHGLREAYVEQVSSATLRVVAYNQESCARPISLIDSELVSAVTGVRMLCDIEQAEACEYKISYQPTVKGRHQLHIKVEGQHIGGSPFSVNVKCSVEDFGTPIRTLEKVSGPDGVTLNQKHQLVVSDIRDHKVHVFSPNLRKLLSFGTRGSLPGQLCFPMGVAVDMEGNILVIDKGNHRVQKFAVDGQFLASVGTKGHGRVQFDSPSGIAFNVMNSKVYITDTWNHRIVLNSDLTFSLAFGSHGNRKGQFSHPRGIACDSSGKVYVCDYDNHNVQIFTERGTFLKSFGSPSDCKGETDYFLNSPAGIAIDESGRVYISEEDNHSITIFTSEGLFVKTFGQLGKEFGQFIHPRGLVVDSSGVIYVCDLDNSRMQLF